MSELPVQKILLVTGPAGAGRTTAINALEDLGYEAIDNMPLTLVPRLLEGPALARPLALGIDSRNRDFDVGQVMSLLRELNDRADLETRLLYLGCSETVLSQRFSETRRRHPLAPKESAREGIRRDLDLMAPIRDRADILIETSDMTVHELRAEIDTRFASSEGRLLSLQVQSFSYKRGLPLGLDMVFDVRFLRNPHWDPALRPLDGRDVAVAEYVAQDPLFAPFRDKVQDLLLMLLPAYKNEGKAHLSIGFGCTGGRHRSVALAENTAKALAKQGWHVSIRHREMDRGAHARPAGTDD